MTEKNVFTPDLGKVARRSSFIAGGALITIGILVMLNNFFDIPSFGNLFMLFLGGIFLIWSLLSRETGLLIPGGILSGIGVGILLVSTSFNSSAEETQGAVFLLSFGAGWLLIWLISLVMRPVQWWALIPGGILGLIGGALMMGGPALDILETAGKWWPLLIIVVGAWIIFKRK